MNLEELLKNREIYRMENAKELAPKALGIAERDLKTAKHLFEKENYDWCLAIAYNAMLQAGRALMFHRLQTFKLSRACCRYKVFTCCKRKGDK